MGSLTRVVRLGIPSFYGLLHKDISCLDNHPFPRSAATSLMLPLVPLVQAWPQMDSYFSSDGLKTPTWPSFKKSPSLVCVRPLPLLSVQSTSKRRLLGRLRQVGLVELR